MSKMNFQNKVEGRHIDQGMKQDLPNKLGYLQLLALYHDLTCENKQLKHVCNQLGHQLDKLHQQFEIKRQGENNELYKAIATHPILQKFQLTLVPLLNAYQNKISEFQQTFETINQQFTNLQNNFQTVVQDNEKLRVQLTDKIKETMELYRKGSTDKMNPDFGQLILQQINQKQKLLVEENARLEKDYQRYKSENEKIKRDNADMKQRYDENKTKVKELEILFRQNQSEIKTLKESVFNGQAKNNDLQNENKKMQQSLDRAQSQINQLSKEKDSLLKRYEKIRNQLKNQQVPINQDQSKKIEDLTRKITFLEAQRAPNDDFKKYDRLQKEYDHLLREDTRRKQALQISKIQEDELRGEIDELRQEKNRIQTQKMQIQTSQNKLKKVGEKLIEKNKNQANKLRLEYEQAIDKNEEECKLKIFKKQKRISQIEENLQRVIIQRDKLEKQNKMDAGRDIKIDQTRLNDRNINKLKEKMSINQDLFKEQMHIMENQNAYLRKEAQNYKIDSKNRAEEILRLRQQLQKTNKHSNEVNEQKAILIEEIRRVRNEYEGNLKDKQRLFDQKIHQIRSVIQDSDTKRKKEKERVQQAIRQYKRVLEDVKGTYEERIKFLENEIQRPNEDFNSKSKYRVEHQIK